MLSDEEKDNVFKISVPIITNEELERLDYTIESDLDNIVHQISETVARDKDIIILKKVIEKQSKEIEELKDESKEYQIGFAQGCYEKDLDWQDKIKAKIEEVKDGTYNAKIVLQSLLEKEYIYENKQINRKFN